MKITPELIEDLSSLEHRQWSGWMKYLFKKGERNKDGSWTIPKSSVERWMRQMTTLYCDLSEEEQSSDRIEAIKVLALVMEHQGAADE